MWQIIQRVNKAALAVGSVTAAIPAYVEPTVTAFRIHRLYGGGVIPAGEPVNGLEGSEIHFYVEFSDPDSLVKGVVITPGRDLDLPIEYAEDGYRLGRGWAIILYFDDPGEYSIAAALLWLDPDGVEHETVTTDLSNGPLTIVPIETSIADATITVFQTASVEISPEGMDIQAEMDWGD